MVVWGGGKVWKKGLLVVYKVRVSINAVVNERALHLGLARGSVWHSWSRWLSRMCSKLRKVTPRKTSDYFFSLRVSRTQIMASKPALGVRLVMFHSWGGDRKTT